MNKVVSDIRLFLFTCSGEDNYILTRCNWGIQKRFALIGFFVLLIFVGCFFSATLFSISLFQGAEWASIPIGIFWGAMVVNMYLLLLHTISPTIIPLASKKKRRKNDSVETQENKNSFLTLSMFCRIGFIMLLAIIIAQPLNYSILSSTIKTELDKHKIQERVKLYALTNKHLIKSELENQKDLNQKIINKLSSNEASQVSAQLQLINAKINRDDKFIRYATQKLKQLDKIDCNLFLSSIEKLKKTTIINDLESRLNDELLSDNGFINDLNSISILGYLKTDYDSFKASMSSLITKKIDNYNKLNDLLNKSNFYVKTIQILLVENPLSWIITLSVCLAFLLPIIFKYKARDISARIFNLKDNEPDIVRLREELINTTNFSWLEKKLKTVNARDIRTSDYYFQRMLIEHKIILEEYDQTKKLFSKKISSNIKKYNEVSKSRLLHLLEKLKKVNSIKYHELYKQIVEEYKDEVIIKYEYWLDMPFRTKRVNTVAITNNEVGLLDFVYNQPDEGENNIQI
ncbi:DUF4407 domain-containing protein [Flavobacterium sp. RSB2_4_14]|uniref:DUF4407 domain-containing protein n=1 Tax=Flavobacterium sp. RSB2_4_14 TaxID=3447665 RepID=UPI003F3A24AE